MDMTKPRGIRNNNPGNIRANGIAWQGMTGDDGEYLIFDTPANGIRALARVLHTYAFVHGLKTIQQIIKRWAPANENDTAAYIAHVAKAVGVDESRVLVFDRAQLMKLVKTIIKHENGQQPYSDATVLEAIRAAGWQV